MIKRRVLPQPVQRGRDRRLTEEIRTYTTLSARRPGFRVQVPEFSYVGRMISGG